MPERGEVWLANLNPRRLTLSHVRSQNLQSPPPSLALLYTRPGAWSCLSQLTLPAEVS